MALIRFPEGQQRSGSAGGSVYSHNRYGAYIRARSIPTNPNTDRQVAMRNNVRSLSIAWQNTLTELQRLAWEGYAAATTWRNKFGESVYLTGLAHYVRSNSARLQAGLARLDAAPTIFNLAAAELALVVTASEATQQLSVAFDDTPTWCDEDGSMQTISMGRPANPSTKFFGGPFRYAGVIEGDSAAPPSSPVLIDAPFVFSEGQRLWVRTRIGRADGRLSEHAQVNFLGAA